MPYGTLQIIDADVTGMTVAEAGEDRVYTALQADLDAHNAMVRDMRAELMEDTEDRTRSFGESHDKEMEDVDEMGSVDAQKALPGTTIGFRLGAKQIAVQWTRMAMQVMTVNELEQEYIANRDADTRSIITAVRKALFIPTNNTAYIDRLIDRVNFTLRALINADSTTIPNGPNAETFDGATHNHYLANATLTEAAALALVETVIEHGHVNGARVYINRSQETTWRGFANFQPYLDVATVPASTTTYAQGMLSRANLYNRAIGMFNGAEVWVKPWMITNYAFAFAANQPDKKPLVFRTRKGGVNANLQMVADQESYPLRAKTFQREFGVSVWTRTNGAVLYSASGSYVTPSNTLLTA